MKEEMKIIKSRAARLPFKVALTCMHTMRNINGREVSLSIKYSTCSNFTNFLDTVKMLKIDFAFSEQKVHGVSHTDTSYMYILYIYMYEIYC